VLLYVVLRSQFTFARFLQGGGDRTETKAAVLVGESIAAIAVGYVHVSHLKCFDDVCAQICARHPCLRVGYVRFVTWIYFCVSRWKKGFLTRSD
jgi:hypothetical protein